MAGVLLRLLCAVLPTSVLPAMASTMSESVLRIPASRVLSPNALLPLFHVPTASPGDHKLCLNLLSLCLALRAEECVLLLY